MRNGGTSMACSRMSLAAILSLTRKRRIRGTESLCLLGDETSGWSASFCAGCAAPPAPKFNVPSSECVSWMSPPTDNLRVASSGEMFATTGDDAAASPLPAGGAVMRGSCVGG